MRRILSALFVLSMVILPAAGTAAQEESDICATLLIPTMESAGLDTALYGEVLGCQHDVYVGWTMRTVLSTRDGVSNIRLSDAGSQLLGQIDDLSMSDTFTYSVRYDRSTSSLYTLGAGGTVSTEAIPDQGIGSAPNWTNNYVEAYADNMETYLLNNAGTQSGLVEYLQWFMARRDATLQSMSSVQNPMLSAAFLSNWGYMQWPWPWQLSDPHAITAYLAITQPQPTQVPPTAESTSGSTLLTLSPTNLIGHPGETVTIDIAYPRLQGIHTVAFMVYSEMSFVGNVPMAFVDTGGDSACSPGSELDIVQPVDRALDVLANPDYPPTHLDVEISDDVRAGDRLAVCVEMVGFSLDREIFFWNARMDIRIAS